MEAVKTFKLEGLLAATFTPMHENGEIDLDRLEPYCQHLADVGITQIYINGTTGEGCSLTLGERQQMVEKWIEVGKKSGRIKAIVVQVGALNLHDSITLAKHAVKAGADAIATVPPLFFKPPHLDYLVKYCKEVASVAPTTPFYFYHIPGATGVEANIEDFLKAGVKEIPTLVGVKFSSKDLVDLIGCVYVDAPHRADNRFNMMYGCDEKLMAGMVMGAHSGVGSTYNFMSSTIHRILDNVQKGDMVAARKDQYLVQQACRVMYKYGTMLGNNVSALKAIMKIRGLDLGAARSPLRGPTDAELASFKQELLECGMEQW